MSEEVAALGMDSHLEALGHVERRRLLRALLQADRHGETSVDIGQLASGADERDLVVSMRHVHLPKLEGMGVVRTDPGSQRVRPGPNFEKIAPLLRLLDEHREELPADWA